MIHPPSSTWFTEAPGWEWLVVWYFFLGALAGGCYFYAAALDLFGRAEDRALSRRAYFLVIPLLIAVGIVLILDLSRPDRFWHLMVEVNTGDLMYKNWTPMSNGTWVILAFSLCAGLSFLAALAETGRVVPKGFTRLRPPSIAGKAIAIVGALLALFICGYTGVLLSVTNRPIWSDTSLLGMLFIVSALAMSAAAMVLLAGRSERVLPTVGALQRSYVWILALELAVIIAVLVSLGPVARAWLNLWGLLLLVGGVLLGIAAPLALYRRKGAPGGRSVAAAAVLVVVGGFILRTVIVLSPHGIEP